MCKHHFYNFNTYCLFRFVFLEANQDMVSLSSERVLYLWVFESEFCGLSPGGSDYWIAFWRSSCQACCSQCWCAINAPCIHHITLPFTSSLSLAGITGEKPGRHLKARFQGYMGCSQVAFITGNQFPHKPFKEHTLNLHVPMASQIVRIHTQAHAHIPKHRIKHKNTWQRNHLWNVWTLAFRKFIWYMHTVVVLQMSQWWMHWSSFWFVWFGFVVHFWWVFFSFFYFFFH